MNNDLTNMFKIFSLIKKAPHRGNERGNETFNYTECRLAQQYNIQKLF